MESIKKCESNKVFKIQIKFPESSLITFATEDNLDKATAIALQLHAMSNTPHSIYVDNGSECCVVLNLYPKHDE